MSRSHPEEACPPAAHTTPWLTTREVCPAAVLATETARLC